MRRLVVAACGVVATFAMLPATAPAEVQKLRFETEPIPIAPGQNTIEIDATRLKPNVPGHITYFKPDLIYADTREIPRVDVIHLHHAVWLINGGPQFAAGEEKSIIDLPDGFGWRHEPDDPWALNHMIHNLTPNATEVRIVWDIEFIPDGAPEAAGMQRVRTQWLDVMGLMAYPVFDALKGKGRAGRFTYPDHDPKLAASNYRRHKQVVVEDGALVGTVGHLHPGGLWTDLELTRNGRTVRLFRSEAKYFEPAGAVSWDVAMTATPQDWRVQVRRGDVLTVKATYDTARASWYESMGIMPVAFAPGATGKDPFAENVDVPGQVTHGPLPENRNHGGGLAGLPDARRLLSGRVQRGAVGISSFVYGRGDLSTTGRAGRPPVVRAGRSLTFLNRDARRYRTVFHTITACKAPCNRETGIAYPLADGRGAFDSGNLGFGPPGFTPAAQRDRWSTPATLRPGTYTYFCRVHPFMRGAFRVKR